MFETIPDAHKITFLERHLDNFTVKIIPRSCLSYFDGKMPEWMYLTSFLLDFSFQNALKRFWIFQKHDFVNVEVFTSNRWFRKEAGSAPSTPGNNKSDHVRDVPQLIAQRKDTQHPYPGFDISWGKPVAWPIEGCPVPVCTPPAGRDIAGAIWWICDCYPWLFNQQSTSREIRSKNRQRISRGHRESTNGDLPVLMKIAC